MSRQNDFGHFEREGDRQEAEHDLGPSGQENSFGGEQEKKKAIEGKMDREDGHRKQIRQSLRRSVAKARGTTRDPPGRTQRRTSYKEQ